MARSTLTLIACLLPLLAWAAPSGAQGIKRCVNAAGVSIFTDRACSEMDAVPMQAPPPSEGNHSGAYRGGFTQRGCARSPEDLLDRVRSALEARDVNRLAGHYHWTGTGTGSGRRLMDELEAITRQWLLSAELVYPEPAEASMAPFPDGSALPPPPSEPGLEPAVAQASPAPPQARQIRVLQMRDDQGEQASSTLFQLRRNAGCWWITL